MITAILLYTINNTDYEVYSILIQAITFPEGIPLVSNHDIIYLLRTLLAIPWPPGQFLGAAS